MNEAQTLIGSIKEAQRMKNKALSEYLDELPYIEAFNDFYKNYSFVWVPRWVQRKLEPMAYKCFRSGVDFQITIQNGGDNMHR